MGSFFAEPYLSGRRRATQRLLSWLLVIAGVFTALSCFATETRKAATGDWQFGTGHDAVNLGGGAPAGAWHPDWIGLVFLAIAVGASIWGRHGGGRTFLAGLANVVLALLAVG